MFPEHPEWDERYPSLSQYAAPLTKPERPVLGRESEIGRALAVLDRPELCNLILLGPPGGGKTAVAQGASMVDVERTYMEVSLSKMIAEVHNPDEMAPRLTEMFEEAERFTAAEDHQLVIFMDEFHQVVQLSPAGVEAIKPVLAASGARGLRIIAATTYEEFHEYIAKNQALVERFERLNIAAPDKPTTIAILRGMAERYKVSSQFVDDHMFEQIYDYTNRYIPASAQPRKSIKVLDAMIGLQRRTGRPMNKSMLADVLMDSVNVNIAFRVDATNIKRQLDERVYSQDFATAVVARRLQLCVADLNDHSRPMASMLFCGSTGVGKSELTKQLAMLLFGDAKERLIRFDMTEFSQEESVETFRRELSQRVWDTPFAVLLLDEIEKAAPAVSRMLLQVLDDGRLSDQFGRQVSFLNTYIVLTTNAGAEIFETIGRYDANDLGDGSQMFKYDRLIRRSITETQTGRFPPELLGRIDVIVPFQPLSPETQKLVVKGKLGKLREEMRTKHDILLKINPDVVDYLIDDKGKGSKDASAGGARAAIARMTDEVVAEVATFVNANPEHRRLYVDVEGEMRRGNKEMVRSQARITVSALVDHM